MQREEKVSATTITSAKGDNPSSRQEFPVIIALVNGVLLFRPLYSQFKEGNAMMSFYMKQMRTSGKP